MTGLSAQRATPEQVDARHEVAFGIAIAYEHHGRLPDARQMYERALQLEPRNASIKENFRRFVEIDDRRIRPIADKGTAAVEPPAP